MASAVSAEGLSEPVLSGSSSDPRDRSHVTACGLRLAPVRGLAAPAAVSASAAACLQSYPTGQLHSPNSNSRSESFRYAKYTTVVYSWPPLPRTVPCSALSVLSHCMCTTACSCAYREPCTYELFPTACSMLAESTPSTATSCMRYSLCRAVTA